MLTIIVSILLAKNHMEGVTMKTTKIFGIVAALVILALSFVIPASEALSQKAIASFCILLSVLVLLLTDALPVAVSVLFGPAMLIFMGVTPPPAAFSGFTNPIVFFILASLIISYAISSTNLSKRMLVALLRLFGKKVEALIFAIMICTAILSSVMSNVAACVIFMTVCLDFLNIYDKEEDRKRTGRAFMIALPISSMIGGMITPAGSSLNLMVIGQLETLVKLTVPFVKWMAMGIPLVAVILPISAFIVIKTNRPAPVSKEKLDDYIKKLHIAEKLSFKEKYVTVIVFAMLVCWILSSWFPIFNITAVAIIGVLLMFLPGLEIFTWQEVESKISWSAILLVASFICLGNAFVSTGAAKWLASLIVPASLNLPVFLVAFIVAIIVFIMLLIIPVAPALVPILAVPLISLAGVVGISPILPMMVLGFTVCNCFLLPFDTVPVITYMTGYYKKADLARSAVLIQLVIAVVVAFWVPFMTGVLHL